MKVLLTLRVFLILSFLGLFVPPSFSFFQNAESNVRAKTKYEFTDSGLFIGDSLFQKREYKLAISSYEDQVTNYIEEGKYEALIYTLERISICYRGLGNNVKSEKNYEKTIELAKRHLPSNHILIAKVYSNNGRRAHHYGDIVEASRYLDSAMSVYNNSNNYDSALLKQIIDYKFYSYYMSNQNIDTLTKYLDYRGLIQGAVPYNPNSRLQLLNDYSRAFLQSGDFQKAMSYSIEGQKLGMESENVRSQEYATALFNLGRSFYGLKQFDRAVEVANELIQFTKENIPDYIQLLAYYNLRAISLSGENRFELAADQFNELIDLLEKRGQKDYFYRSTLMNLGVCYELMGELNLAKTYLYRALTYERNADSVLNVNYAERYKYLGQYYNAKKEYGKSILYYDSALRSGVLSYKASLLDFPEDSLLKPTFRVLTILKSKSLAFIDLNASLPNDSIGLLTSALEYVEKTQDYLMSNREALEASQGKLFLSENFKSLYEAGISASYKLYKSGYKSSDYFDKAMRFSALSKSILFLEQSGEIGVIQDSDLSISVKREVFDLKTNIDLLESSFYGLSLIDIGSDSIRAINSELLILYQNLEHLKDSLFTKTENGVGRFLVNELNTKRLSAYINSRPKTAIIEYFVGTKDIYIFGMAAGKQKMLKVPLSKEFQQAFERVLREVSSRPNINDFSNSVIQFQKDSNYLYEVLIGDLIEEFGEKIEKLIIVPDEQLSKLPFEILLQENKGDEFFYNLSYLLNDYDITYSLSSQRISMDRKNRKRAKYGLLGIGYSGDRSSTVRSEYGDLPGTEDEIRFLKSKIEGKYLLGNEGNKSKFLSIAKDYDILHLAVHGKSDSLNRYKSSLLFNGNGQDNILKTSDLYVAGLNSRIAVLSACESGLGEINKGEGTFSIARGFSLVGVPTVVMSLWKVNDQIASELMVDMYEEFSLGKSITNSLSSTKRNYIKESDEYTSHPYYWAAFVALGEDVYLKENENKHSRMLWVYLALGFATLFFIVAFRKKRKGVI